MIITMIKLLLVLEGQLQAIKLKITFFTVILFFWIMLNGWYKNNFMSHRNELAYYMHILCFFSPFIRQCMYIQFYTYLTFDFNPKDQSRHRFLFFPTHAITSLTGTNECRVSSFECRWMNRGNGCTQSTKNPSFMKMFFFWWRSTNFLYLLVL
jgi:hypothetical protein